MIINCKEISNNIREDIKKLVQDCDRAPKLAVILVGNDPASQVYVRNKNRACEEVGIECLQIDFPEDTTFDAIEGTINNLNLDSTVDGILLQLPLPDSLKEYTSYLINCIDPSKDVDGLTNVNVGRLWNGEDGLFPCTALGVVEILKRVHTSLKGLNVCIVGRSKLVGKPLIALLQREDSTVTSCNSNTIALRANTSKSSIVITSIGQAKYFDNSYFDDFQTLIDVGINRDCNGKLCGDIDIENVLTKYNVNYTPVPGGVGVMTVTMLLSNTLKAYKMRCMNV